MIKRVLLGILLVASTLACTQARADEAAPDPAPGAAPLHITVIGTTPFDGFGIDRDEIPADTVVLTPQDISRTGPASLTRALNEDVGGITLDDATGNPFQPNLLYRGFEASPLVGDAQGLAVYVNGTRFNSSFGETVNFDLIPDIAIEKVNLAGFDPAYGLNALGGALSVSLKNGFDFAGTEFEFSGGSFGRLQGTAQNGTQFGNFSNYTAVNVLSEEGYRQYSPSNEHQFYSDWGWRDDGAEAHVNVTYADNTLTGNGTGPVELLQADPEGVFTTPDATDNQYERVVLTGSKELGYSTSVQGNVYYSNLGQRTTNGDSSDATPCAGDPALLCDGNGGPLTSTAGTQIANFVTGSLYAAQFSQYAAGGPYSYLNLTATDTDSYGGLLQATNTDQVFGLANHLVVGGSYDGGHTTFTASTLVGGLALDRNYFGDIGPGIPVDDPGDQVTPVRVITANDYYGLFATDTLNLTARLAATLSGRFNAAQVILDDQLGTALNGNHVYNRFNPGAGLTYKLEGNVTAFASYAETNRVPTPAELSCASPADACSLTNFFIGDPNLKQVVAHAVEAGLRGEAGLFAHGQLRWNASLFRTVSDDDLEFVSSPTSGRAYFENIGATQREGGELGATLRDGALHAYIDYEYTRATFRNALTLSSPDNPYADAGGNIYVQPGDRLPGIPLHQVKFGAEYDVTAAWTVGFDGIAASGQYLFGDEANLTSQTPPYVVINLDTKYQVTENLQLFVQVQNVFDTTYYTYGTFSPTSQVPIVQAPTATNTRSLGPAAPIGVFGGLRVSF